ncbi:hypothetical protein EV421DRAFT_975608 [Armillaria borealis]|uniref:Secreted protein n=1 Tax=Armillaria borealis TaxID=47425 RepID=A0AA39JAC3_9AGAR|nr:hypothetical protein EV421DRAFT_975608 [Armillaria borealis]
MRRSARLPWCWCWCWWPGPGPGSVQRTTAFKVQTVLLRRSASDLLARHPLGEEPGELTRAQETPLPWSNSDPPSLLDTKSISCVSNSVMTGLPTSVIAGLPPNRPGGRIF